jgi:uncharacterized protein
MNENNYKKNLFILSIDGGGIRGIIPAMILCEIESKTKKSISELFDLMAGTSTGGILVGGLSMADESKKQSKYKAKDLVEFYKFLF